MLSRENVVGIVIGLALLAVVAALLYWARDGRTKSTWYNLSAVLLSAYTAAFFVPFFVGDVREGSLSIAAAAFAAIGVIIVKATSISTMITSISNGRKFAVALMVALTVNAYVMWGVWIEIVKAGVTTPDLGDYLVQKILNLPSVESAKHVQAFVKSAGADLLADLLFALAAMMQSDEYVSDHQPDAGLSPLKGNMSDQVLSGELDIPTLKGAERVCADCGNMYTRHATSWQKRCPDCVKKRGAEKGVKKYAEKIDE